MVQNINWFSKALILPKNKQSRIFSFPSFERIFSEQAFSLSYCPRYKQILRTKAKTKTIRLSRWPTYRAVCVCLYDHWQKRVVGNKIIKYGTAYGWTKFHTRSQRRRRRKAGKGCVRSFESFTIWAFPPAFLFLQDTTYNGYILFSPSLFLLIFPSRSLVLRTWKIDERKIDVVSKRKAREYM